MEDKKKTSGPDKKSTFKVCVLLLCVVLVVAQFMMPVYAAEDPIEAEVTVTSPAAESYGASVAASSGVLLLRRALGEPDNRGSLILRGGWVSIELEGTVTNCRNISVWLAKRGWRASRFKIYASSDGSDWAHISEGNCISSSYTRYDFSGAFGDVKYIKVERNERWSWSIMLLDAVYAKGGDAQQVN